MSLRCVCDCVGCAGLEKLERHPVLFKSVTLLHWVLVLILLDIPLVLADEIRPGYVQITQTGDTRFDVFFKVPARGINERLAVDLRFDKEIKVLSKPVSGFDGRTHNQSFAIQSQSRLQGQTLEVTGLTKTNTEVLLRITYLSGRTVVHRLTPDNPVFKIKSEGSWQQVAATYFVLGVEHIWFGWDHLLFVFVLLLLVPTLGKLVSTITAFTLAHSITLILAALNWLKLPVPPVEACIALSIVFVASEIIKQQQGKTCFTVQNPWLVAFGFGLLHGLGFAAALTEIGLPHSAVIAALLMFNLGVEVGQLVFVAALAGAWWACAKYLRSLSNWGVRVAAYGVGSLAAFWVLERTYAFW